MTSWNSKWALLLRLLLLKQFQKLLSRRPWLIVIVSLSVAMCISSETLFSSLSLSLNEICTDCVPPLWSRLQNFAPPSPSCPPMLSWSFASPYLTCGPFLNADRRARKQWGRRCWCWNWRTLSCSTRRPQTSRKSRQARRIRVPHASPSCWKLPSQTCMVGLRISPLHRMTHQWLIWYETFTTLAWLCSNRLIWRMGRRLFPLHQSEKEPWLSPKVSVYYGNHLTWVSGLHWESVSVSIRLSFHTQMSLNF